MASDAMIADLQADLQDRIRALLADDPAGYLPATEGGWRRIFGRLPLGESSWALLAYEPEVGSGSVDGSGWSARMVEVFDTVRAVRAPSHTSQAIW